MADDDQRSDSEIHDDLFPVEDQPLVDAGSPSGVRKQRTRSRLEATEGAKFWRGCLATKVGRRELWRILQSAHAFETKFACGPNGFPQSEATWFARGEQDLGLRIFFSWQRIDPESVLLMQQENDPRFVKLPEPRTAKGES
jgi:hypothetical protein